MKNAFLLFLIFLAVLACGEKEAVMPIPEDKLAKVIVDVHFAESVMQELPNSVRDSLGRVYYEQIYQIHGISEEALNESLRVIKNRPEMLERIYQRAEMEIDRQTEALR